MFSRKMMASSSSAPDAKDTHQSSDLSNLFEYAHKILSTNDKTAKAVLTLEAWDKWQHRNLSLDARPDLRPPDFPARPTDLQVLPPKDVANRGKGGNLANRIAMIHSQAHIESFAIDLSWDIILRFCHVQNRGITLPSEYFQDWLKVAADEARHYSIWADRLQELGSSYGALPVHNGLWGSATQTSNDICARLAIVHMVHEARGLDVTPQTISRFQQHGDPRSAELLAAIYEDEITHVTTGMKWFRYICNELKLDPIDTFHTLVRANFRGNLKPPFNEQARTKAGFTEEWYLPLVDKNSLTTTATAPDTLPSAAVSTPAAAAPIVDEHKAAAS